MAFSIHSLDEPPLNTIFYEKLHNSDMPFIPVFALLQSGQKYK
jgi:hypothetical protein